MHLLQTCLQKQTRESSDLQSRLPLVIKDATLRRGGGFKIDMWQASVHFLAVAAAFSSLVAFWRASCAILTPRLRQQFHGRLRFQDIFIHALAFIGDFGATICSCGLQWCGATIHPYVIMLITGHSSSSSSWIVLISTGVSSGSTTVRAWEEL